MLFGIAYDGVEDCGCGWFCDTRVGLLRWTARANYDDVVWNQETVLQAWSGDLEEKWSAIWREKLWWLCVDFSTYFDLENYSGPQQKVNIDVVRLRTHEEPLSTLILEGALYLR